MLGRNEGEHLKQRTICASGDSDLVFLRDTLAQCPGESWGPALMAGTRSRAMRTAQPPPAVKGCPAGRRLTR